MPNSNKYKYNVTQWLIAIIITELLFWSIALASYKYIDLYVKEFRFENPNHLWLFCFIPFIIIIWNKSLKWKNKTIKKFASKKNLEFLFDGFSNIKSVLKFILLRLSLSFLVIAIANPQYGENQRQIEAKGIDIMIALDVSKSMQAEDLREGYSRLKVAKLGIAKMIQSLHSDYIGIVVFAGDAFKQLPITPDYQVATMFLKNIETQMISSQGTDIGNAIDKCVSSFDFERETNKTIIILSDGEDHQKQGISAAEDAYSQGIIINTIGMATTKGVPIPIYRNGKAIGIKKDENNQTVLTKLNEQMLYDIAEVGNGVYSRANGMDIGIENILNRINKIEKATLDVDRYTSYDDQFQPYLLIAIILFILNILIIDKRGKHANKLNFFNK